MADTNENVDFSSIEETPEADEVASEGHLQSSDSLVSDEDTGLLNVAPLEETPVEDTEHVEDDADVATSEVADEQPEEAETKKPRRSWFR